MSARLSRRETLRLGGTALATALAGCTSGGRESDSETTTSAAGTTTATRTTTTEKPTTTTTTEKPTTTRTTTIASDERLREVTVVSGTVSAEHEAVLSAAMVEEDVTPEHPARVLVVLTNTADRNREFETGTKMGFGTVYSDGAPPALALLSPDRDVERAAPGCWVPAEPPGVPETLNSAGLNPGESAYAVLDVWGHPGNADPCLPTGAYRFVEEYEADPPAGGGSQINFSLAVTLAVTNPS